MKESAAAPIFAGLLVCTLCLAEPLIGANQSPDFEWNEKVGDGHTQYQMTIGNGRFHLTVTEYPPNTENVHPRTLDVSLDQLAYASYTESADKICGVVIGGKAATTLEYWTDGSWRGMSTVMFDKLSKPLAIKIITAFKGQGVKIYGLR